MKVRKKEVRLCENMDGTKTNVLVLEYTHRRKKGRILVKDYNDEYYSYVLKQLRKEVTKAFL
jgi:hypothetical protein